MFSKGVEQALVILLGRIEVGMHEGPFIVIAPLVDDFGILAHPEVKAAFLLRTRNPLRPSLRRDRRLEMIGHCDQEMNMPAHGSAQCSQRPAGQHLP